MLRTPPRLRQLFRSVPPQLRLAALVLAAALASAAYHRLSVPGSRLPAPSFQLSSGREPRAASREPSQRIEDAFQAARKGDLDGYLAQFADPLRAQLARTRAERGDRYLRDYLARLTGPVKGLAFDPTRREEVAPETVRFPVEFIYADRNEIQTFVLQREGDRWRIRSIDTPRSAPTLIPYGTPIQQLR
jgi:hypothetical protein